MANNNGTLKFLKENWFLIIAAASIISMGVTAINKSNNNEKHIEAMIKEFSECKLEVRDLKKDFIHLADIMSRNESALNEVKSMVKEIRDHE